MFESPDALVIKIEQVVKTEAVRDLAAPRNRVCSTGKITLTELREHRADIVVQLAKSITAGDIRAAENCVDRFRLRLSLDGNAVELQHRELVAKASSRFLSRQ